MLSCDGNCATVTGPVQCGVEWSTLCVQYISSDRHGEDHFRLFLKMLLRTVLDTGSVSVCGAH